MVEDKVDKSIKRGRDNDEDEKKDDSKKVKEENIVTWERGIKNNPLGVRMLTDHVEISDDDDKSP